jgi:hypothetical protein
VKRIFFLLTALLLALLSLPPVQIELGLLRDFELVVDGIEDPALNDAVSIDIRDSKGVIGQES